jgi:hypothetical protein
MVTVPVHYTPGQLRNAVGIGQETYRHWKKAIAPLRREVGHSPCFTAGDLLATLILKILVSDHGMRVSALSALANSVFEECNSRSWPILGRSLVVLHIASGGVSIQSEGGGLVLDGPAMVVPLGTLMERLRRTLLAGDDDGQEMLRFPPVAQPANSVPRRAG